MTTVGKIAIGAAVVGGVVIVYKLLNPSKVSTTAKANASSPSSAVSGLLDFASSLKTYFGHSTPSAQAVPSVGFPPDTFDTRDVTSVNEFRSESPNLTDSERDDAILG